MEIILILLYIIQIAIVLCSLSSSGIFSTKTSFWLNLIPFYYLTYIQEQLLVIFKESFKKSIEEYNKLN